MPQKKKRGGGNSQVVTKATKMPTRSTKPNKKGPKAAETVPKPPKKTLKKPRAPAKKVKGAAVGRKGRGAKATVVVVEEMTSTPEEGVDGPQEPPVEQLVEPHGIEEAPIDETPEIMETEEVPVAAVEETDTSLITRLITQQLKTLEMVPAVAPQEGENIEEAPVENPAAEVVQPVYEFGEIGGEIMVECVTEDIELAPETQEVIIENEAETASVADEIQIQPAEADIVEEKIEPTVSPENTEKIPETPQETPPPPPPVEEPPPEVLEKSPEKKEKPVKPKKKAAPKKRAPKEPKKTQNGAEKAKKAAAAAQSAVLNEEVRRSSRIKSISVQKQRSRGHGLAKIPKQPEQEVETLTESVSSSPALEVEKPANSPTVTVPPETDNKPVKVKSRWRRSSELEMNVLTPAAVVQETCGDSEKIEEATTALLEKKPASNPEPDVEIETRLKQFVHLKENLYRTDRMVCKEAKSMSCDCFLTPEEIERGEFGCGEDCLNRLLMIECGGLCPVSDRCTNKKFQKSLFAPVEVFKTDKKGLGLRAAANIPYGEFILEYVGEVLDPEEFDIRADDYSNDNNRHYYFMSLRADAIIDATLKGNISRFINHSCDPNAETQKWTVNGELRIGFFSTRTILAGEEITFDYRFQRYGKEAQKCFCEAPTCRGWLGEKPESEDEYEDEEDEEEEEEETSDAKKQETSPLTEKLEDNQQAKVKTGVQKAPKKERKKRTTPRKKVRKEIFDDLDLDEEIEMLVTTGLKNQAHTLKLSRLVVRAKEPAQRTKLMRILRRGELPCRRLFLDYHGLRLLHGYMTDAQQLAKTDRKYESLRLEMVQTLATLPIPNKTMLQDSKVLSTVETWSRLKGTDLPADSDSCSPKMETEAESVKPDENTETDLKSEENTEPLETPVSDVTVKSESPSRTPEEPPPTPMEVDNNAANPSTENEVRKSVGMDSQDSLGNNSASTNFVNTHGADLASEISNIFQEDTETPTVLKEVKTEVPEKVDVAENEPNYEEEIIALALKLLEEWAVLKEVFKIPKKERIEQMKEHEREANRGYISAGLGMDQDEKKTESRYRILKRYRTFEKVDNSLNRKNVKLDDRTFANFPKLDKYERRKMFALQVEQREEERRRKQREMWRQHEQHCILLGTDPRLTAPFDPNRGYQCIWNPQIGQWQNYPLQNPNLIFNAQNAALNIPQPTPGYPYLQPNLHSSQILQGNGNPLHPLPALPYQDDAKGEEDCSKVKFMGPIPPPVKLPPKWKCAKDKYGRPYYYHVKIRKSQWEPPPHSQPITDADESSETTSSSDTSSLSSDTSSEDSDSDDDIDDTKLMLQVKKRMERQIKTPVQQPVKTDEPEVQTPMDEDPDESWGDPEEEETDLEKPGTSSKDDNVPILLKRKRTGLVQELIISPRTDEDRLQFREDLKRYKMNKEKLKREKEQILQQSKKHTKEKRHNKTIIKLKMKEMNDSNSEQAKKIKESFRSSMATVVVAVLNVYRKPDCKEGRITNTEDFKHLARKLTHFVMLKEMKHIEKIEDLVCTENVKAKAREYIRKYMSKFGDNYQKRPDEPDY